MLGALESAVMDYLWDGGEGEAKGVHTVLGRRRGITLNTIQSTLKRLYEKGLLAREKVSHAHVYRPSIARADFQRGALGELVDELMRGEAEAMVAAFVDLTERAGEAPLRRLEVVEVSHRRAQINRPPSRHRRLCPLGRGPVRSLVRTRSAIRGVHRGRVDASTRAST